MALTPSSMLPLGTQAPDFSLEDVVTGQQVQLSKTAHGAKATVVMFLCNHCPYVKHILPELLNVTRQYTDRGIHFIAINANDVEHYPADHPDKMRELALTHQFVFPYLFDATQAVAKSYHATCTPDFFVFDHLLTCVYRGRFDDTSPGRLQNPVSGNELRAVLEAVLGKGTINPNQHPSMGCNIKWKDH